MEKIYDIESLDILTAHELRGSKKGENMNGEQCLEEDVLPVFYWQGERTQNRH